MEPFEAPSDPEHGWRGTSRSRPQHRLAQARLAPPRLCSDQRPAPRGGAFLVDSLGLVYDLIRGLSPEAVDSLPTGQLETIATAFSGSFLSDLYLPHCPSF